MEKYMQRAEELKESVTGNYEHSTDIQDYELVQWLIEQAKKAGQYEKSLNVVQGLASFVMLSEAPQQITKIEKYITDILAGRIDRS